MTFTLNQFSRAAATLTALSACLIVGTAHAASSAGAPSVTVRYGDLNLSSEQGAVNSVIRKLRPSPIAAGSADGR